MQLIINGESKSFPGVTTVFDLLEKLDLHGRVAVEVNEQIVPRSEFSSRVLQQDDRIEIVHAIGGG